MRVEISTALVWPPFVVPFTTRRHETFGLAHSFRNRVIAARLVRRIRRERIAREARR